MTVNDNDGRVQVVATSNGQATFDFDFKITSSADIKIYFTDVSAGTAAEPLVETTDYTVPSSALNNENGGTITFTAARTAVIETGDLMTFEREIAAARSADYLTGGDFQAATVNAEFDKIFLILQELERSINRKFGVSVDDDTTTLSFPAPQSGKPLIGNGGGTAFVNGDELDLQGTLISALSVVTGLANADVFALYSQAQGENRSITYQNLYGELFKAINSLTDLSSLQATDKIALFDTSATEGKGVTLSNLFAALRANPVGTIYETGRIALPTSDYYTALWCNGASVSRATYADLFAALTHQESVTLTNASATISSVDLSNTSGIGIGCRVEGASIPDGTTISNITGSLNSRTITLSANATADSTETVTFIPFGAADASNFNLPDDRSIAKVGVSTMGDTSDPGRLTYANSNVRPDSLGSRGGHEEMQAHTHPYNDPDNGQVGVALGGGDDCLDEFTAGAATGSTGGGDSQNVQPTGVRNFYIIAT